MENDGWNRRCPRSGMMGCLTAAALLLCLAVCSAQAPPPSPREPTTEHSLRLRIRPLPDDVRKVQLTTDDHGRNWYVIEHVDGTEERLDPNAFAARLDHDNRENRRLFAFLNITSSSGIVWVVLGLAGQILFAGRMIVQWLVSERNQRSVVPVAFWWMSLAGASMLLTYFVWRRDIVGVLGQGTGWLIYCRNLWLLTQANDS